MKRTDFAHGKRLERLAAVVSERPSGKCQLGKTLMRGLLLTLMAVCLGGCGVHGHKIDPTVANGIQKGETRASVESKLGEPDFEDLPDNGICHVRYTFSGNKPDTLSMVPYLNLFAGGQKIRNQNLFITYKDDVVVGSRFSDNTMQTSGGLFNMHVRQKPTPGAHSQPSTAPVSRSTNEKE